ncbi:E3 ubiquitin-protein ligase RGLG4-like [Patiria miniata]|uniref:VWFA domain-containing protein n=1 Tax=Patiria miniata TaxID=46514 RepID=A0A914BQM0_PATMI|nr:E3 ubiquitin-protein ligase RGLG4-like [Patiria miniata]
MSFIVQVAFVGLVIFITHKIYECFTRASKARNHHTEESTASSQPPREPPPYSSLYPDLTKDKTNNAAKNASPCATAGACPSIGSTIARVLGWASSTSSSFKTIRDNFNSLDEVSNAIRRAGLESSNLIFGIDYTKSNLYTGQQTFGGRSLHTLVPGIQNPYQQAISILGQTLAPFDDDNLLPVFGFGDLSTQGHSVFPFRADGVCHGFQDVLECYDRITPAVTLSGPTDFAPVINEAIRIVQKTKAYHILVIIADGQVTSEKPTRDAIVAASGYPLSIVVVGVGDGPWDMMREFDDHLPRRKFDNFQFVEFHRVMMSARGNKEASFALHALMEIPDQYLAIRKLNLLG